ncbi:MAG: NAD-dependent epimerase/dehydratase family protein [Planctomycetes bacterium]|nr:NAD-dependent epimerase/dehydratase family protein [Planctomycetota bacterium]
MKQKKYLVTGGGGFIGSALVKRLVRDGRSVRVLDDGSRGGIERLAEVVNDIDYITGDIRDAETVLQAAQGVDSICHLAFVNGTEFFYSKPEVVLDVGVRGMINVLDACRENLVGELVLASSSEVYQSAPVVPTDEMAPLTIPDVHNPRYSYAGGKIISEIMALNYGRKYFERVLIFRPHNVYGPQMGFEHVIPQFVLRMKELIEAEPDTSKVLQFPIQGSGVETRAFVYIDDFTDGLMKVMKKGEHLGIYHIGTTDEISMIQAVRAVGKYFNREIDIIAGQLAPGGTARRCPDIRKIQEMGYQPRYSFEDGLAQTARWYVEHAHEAPPQKITCGITNDGGA